MFFDMFGISKRELLEKSYHMSKEIEALNNRICELENKVYEIRIKDNKKPSKNDKKGGIITFCRKTEKGIDGQINHFIEKGYILILKQQKKNLWWEAKMEKIA